MVTIDNFGVVPPNTRDTRTNRDGDLKSSESKRDEEVFVEIVVEAQEEERAIFNSN